MHPTYGAVMSHFSSPFSCSMLKPDDLWSVYVVPGYWIDYRCWRSNQDLKNCLDRWRGAQSLECTTEMSKEGSARQPYSLQWYVLLTRFGASFVVKAELSLWYVSKKILNHWSKINNEVNRCSSSCRSTPWSWDGVLYRPRVLLPCRWAGPGHGLSGGKSSSTHCNYTIGSALR